MYAVMGITGNVGGSTARALLADGNKVRGIVRNRAKAVAWEAAGNPRNVPKCEAVSRRN
jgi:NAD(P)H dehydrogenase (quinone)